MFELRRKELLMNGSDYYMGEEYYYRKTDDYDTEIRFFMLDLADDIDKQMRFIEEHNVNGLSLSTDDSKGIVENYQLAFQIIGKLRNRLLLLNLTNFHEFEQLDILDFLPGLKELSLHCNLKTPFDFTKLPELESLELWYGKAFSNIFECTSIKKLEIYKMDAKAMENIQNLHSLKELQIRQTSIRNVNALSNLSELENLVLRYLPKLESIYPIHACKNIKSLLFQNCKKVSDWYALGLLPELQRLVLENCGTIQSLGELKAENLKMFGMIGDTKLM